MRVRSTWQGKDAAIPRQAATHRQADVYTMNQEHPQPSPIDYENGDPDSWAESWHGYGDVEQEYEGGHVKRNELGFGEMLDNTYKHKDSDHWHSGKGNYDNVKDGDGKFENPSGKSTGEKPGRTYEAGSRTPVVAGDRRDQAERKAKAVERITRAMLRTSNEKLITDVALGFMGMPDRVVVAALRALDAVSPDALPIENKTRRAMACTKLAVQLIGDNSEKAVEVLATTLMSIDDPTLKSIMSQVATARVAQQQEEQEEGTHTSQQEEQDQGAAPPAPPAPPAAQGQQQQQGQKMMPAQQQQQGQQEQMSQEEQLAQQLMAQQEQMSQQQQQGQCDEMGMPHMGNALPPAELQMLDQMLKEEMGGQGCPPGDDLQALFEVAPVPVAPAAPVAPVMASQGVVDISFDDDEEGVPAIASDTADLDNLFSDNEEVQAQRQISAAAQEQAARENGFSIGRTASSKGAKKIGNIQRGKPASVDNALESLWERP